METTQKKQKKKKEINKFLGINGQLISKFDIPFDTTELADIDIIENDNGEALMYVREHRSYIFLNDDPTKYLIDNGISVWRKR